MTDVVLRIGSEVAAGTRGIRAFKDEVAQTGITTRDLREQWKATSVEIAAQQRKQIAGEKEKAAAIRLQIAAIKDVTASYARGSEERQLATKTEIDLQRRLQTTLGETAVVAARSGRLARNTAERDAGGFARGAASRSGVAGAGLAGLAGPGFIAGAVIGGAVDLGVRAARDEQVAQANLQNALRDTGQARAISRKALEEYVVTEEHATGFTRDQVMQTLSQLIRSTGSLTKARQEEAIMANIARARQTDLSGAYMLVVKAGMGNVGALRRLGIEVAKTTTYEDQLKAAHLTGNIALERRAKALDLAATKSQVMAAVTRKFAGDSSAYMHTFAGRTAELSNTFHDLEVEIGNKSIPALTRLFGWITKELEAAKTSKTVHDVLHDTLAVLKTAWDGLSVIVRTVADLMHNKLIRDVALATGAIWLLNRAVEANPWVAAAAAAILAVGIIHKHWSAIHAFFENLWAGIKATFFLAWDDMKIGAVKAVLQIIEPFSHLPGSMGKWARDMKDSLHTELDAMRVDAARQGTMIGEAIGGNAYKAAAPSIAKIAAAFAAATDPTKVGMTPAQIASAAGVTQAQLPGGKGQGAQVARAAFGLLGTQYVWGGGHGATPGPSKGTRGDPRQPEAPMMVGLDCSGLARAALAAAGIKVPPLSADGLLRAAKQHPSVSDLQPGDLVFYEGSHPNHVAVYIGGGKVIHDPHAGASAEVADLHMMKITGTGRYTDSHPSKTKAAPPPRPDANTQADAAWQALVAQASAAAKAAKTAKSGLKAPTLIGLQGSIAAELKALPAELDPVEKAAVAHIKQIRDSLHVGMPASELAKDRVALARWGKTLSDEIHKNAKTAAKAARDATTAATKAAQQAAADAKKPLQEAARQAAQAWQAGWGANVNIIGRQISEQWSLVQRDFDRETQAGVTKMQREVQAKLTTMQRAFQAQMTQFDRDTQTGLDSLVVQQTPEEQTLAAFQAQRAAAQLATTKAQQQIDLVAAIQSGDPAQIKQAQDAIDQTLADLREQALKDAADQSRQAADDKTKRDQQAYQDQRDALKQSLEDDEAVREQAYQDAADLDQRNYEDRRAAQWTALNDLHDDQVAMFDADLKVWSTALEKKQKAWTDFLTWLQQNPTSKGFDGGAITNPQGAADQVTTAALIAAADKGGDSGIASYLRAHAVHQAAGGITMRPTATMRGEQGPEATFPLSGQQGQAAIALLARAIAAQSGGGGGVGPFIFNGHVTDEKALVEDFRSVLLDVGRRNGSKTGSIWGGRG